MKVKWEPKVEYVIGDQYPWKGYAVSGKKKELIMSAATKIYHHSNFLCVLEEIFKGDEKKINEYIATFYKSTGFSKRPWSGKKEAYRNAEEYCNMANGE